MFGGQCRDSTIDITVITDLKIFRQRWPVGGWNRLNSSGVSPGGAMTPGVTFAAQNTQNAPNESTSRAMWTHEFSFENSVNNRASSSNWPASAATRARTTNATDLLRLTFRHQRDSRHAVLRNMNLLQDRRTSHSRQFFTRVNDARTSCGRHQDDSYCSFRGRVKQSPNRALRERSGRYSLDLECFESHSTGERTRNIQLPDTAAHDRVASRNRSGTLPI
jgi:hypothetical protein